MHLGYPIADGMTGVFGAFGLMTALFHRAKNPELPGEEIDLSLYESMHRILEFLVIEYDQLGAVRERSGNRSQYAVPSGVYRTRDDRWVSLACSTQSVWERLAQAMGRDDLIDDLLYQTNADRVANSDGVEEIATDWFAANDFSYLSDLLGEKGVAFSLVFTAKDACEDPHYAARENIVPVADSELGEIRMQGIVPKLKCAGSVRRAGPALGQHTDEVYSVLLGLSGDELLARADEQCAKRASFVSLRCKVDRSILPSGSTCVALFRSQYRQSFVISPEVIRELVQCPKKNSIPEQKILPNKLEAESGVFADALGQESTHLRFGSQK